MLRRCVVMVVGMLLVSAAATAAQPVPPRVRVGAGLSADLLVGDASDFLDGGGGRFLMADFRIGTRDRWHIRLDGNWTGLDDDEDEVTGAKAENDVLTLVGGPQLSFRLGRVRPYIAALAGFTAVTWRTEVPLIPEDDDPVRDDGGDAGFAWGGHGGIALTLDEGNHPVAIQFEARLLQAGTYDFARAPAIGNPAAPVGLIREDFATMSLRILFTLGF